jgi:hypothetical protein
MVEARRMAPLPGGEPGGQFLEPAERAGGLRQLALAHRRGGTSVEIGPRQMRQQRTDLVQIGHRLGHGRSFDRTLPILSEVAALPKKKTAMLSANRRPGESRDPPINGSDGGPMDPGFRRDDGLLIVR